MSERNSNTTKIETTKSKENLKYLKSLKEILIQQRLKQKWKEKGGFWEGSSERNSNTTKIETSPIRIC